MIKHITLQFLHSSARKLLTVQHGARLPNQEEKMNEHAQNTGHFFNKKITIRHRQCAFMAIRQD